MNKQKYLLLKLYVQKLQGNNLIRGGGGEWLGRLELYWPYRTHSMVP